MDIPHHLSLLQIWGVHVLCPCTSSSKSTAAWYGSAAHISIACILIGIIRFRYRELTAFLVNVIHQALSSWLYGRESLGLRLYSLYNHSKIRMGQDVLVKLSDWAEETELICSTSTNSTKLWKMCTLQSAYDFACIDIGFQHTKIKFHCDKLEIGCAPDQFSWKQSPPWLWLVVRLAINRHEK